MQITKPTFYKEFSCIAGACPDTCCAGWQIMIDEKSLQKYRRFKGPFRNRLHNDIDWKSSFSALQNIILSTFLLMQLQRQSVRVMKESHLLAGIIINPNRLTFYA